MILALLPYAILILCFSLLWSGILPAVIAYLVTAFSFFFGSGLFLWGLYLMVFGSHRQRGQKLFLSQCVFPMGLVWMLLAGWGAPMINDVSTDIEHPPEFQWIPEQRGVKADEYLFPEQNKKIIREAYPRLNSEAFVGRVEPMMEQVADELRSWPQTQEVHVDKQRQVLEWILKTPVFRFTDDVILRFSSMAADKVRIDIRSKSRVGVSDRGVNAKRILILYEVIKKRLTSS